MMNTLTILRTCPICGTSGLLLLPEINVRVQHQEVCENEYYRHVRLGNTHYFVRKNKKRLFSRGTFDLWTENHLSHA